MSNSLNRAVLTGRFVKDPEFVELSNDNQMVKFTIAVNNVWIKDGQKQEEVSFIDCVLFGSQAQFIKKYGSKGRLVGIDGRLHQDKWLDKETNEKRSKLIVKVDKVEFMDSPKQNESEAEDNSPPVKQENKPSQVSKPVEKPKASNQVQRGKIQVPADDDIPF